MIAGGSPDFYDTVIIGSGIAGSVLAFELEKQKKNYFICTAQKSPLSNTSALSHGHCRIPKQNRSEEIVNRSALQLGEDEKRMNFIYSNAEMAIDLFKELNIDFEHRSFGIIPLCNGRGGRNILEKMQEKIPSIETETELTDFEKNNSIFEVRLRKNKKSIIIKCKHLVLATGGYGGIFEHNDNFQYKNYNVFDIVKKNRGEIINIDCVFVHPFGYQKGKKILLGSEIKEGEFLDSDGNFAFDHETRQLIKQNNYHEIFDKLVEQINNHTEKGRQVYFVDSRRKIAIKPTVHYTSGGIKTDFAGRVIGFENLFAIGECKADGSRNGGRFPGYPFTSAIVNAKILAKNIL